MKTLYAIVLCVSLAGLCACGGKTHTLSQKEIQETVDASRIDRDQILGQANQSMSLGLTYYDERGYEKSADLFMGAADFYRMLPDNEAEKQALMAAGKARLKAGNRDAFINVMARYKGLIREQELPTEEERFFLNLDASMRGTSLPYPMKDAWRRIFN